MSALGADIAADARIDRSVRFSHGGRGVVIHGNCEIGRNVLIFHNVTLGRSDAYQQNDSMQTIVIREDAVLCVGAVVLGNSRESVTLGAGSVLGANSVLSSSTGPWEIWSGIPARRVAARDKLKPRRYGP